MEVICSHKDRCPSTCSHKLPRGAMNGCDSKPCSKINAARCIPITSSVKPSSTATKSSNNPPKEAKKETTEMKNLSIIEKVTAATKNVVAQQPEIVKSAAILEAAEILTNKVVDLAKPKLPFMLKGYADTPIFRAVIANVALVAIETALPDVDETDVRKQIAAAAAVGAYKDVIGSFNIGDMIDGLFGGKDMQKLIAKAETGVARTSAPKAPKAPKAAKATAAEKK